MTAAVEVEVCRLDVAPGVAEELDRTLSGTERARARRYAFDRDRRRFVVGRGHLRRRLAARLGLRPGASSWSPVRAENPGFPPAPD